jgi:L,D-peptidoglycan transpeptidase YkuD (ErfK/YbiS/YcfS/YnhG family)
MRTLPRIVAAVAGSALVAAGAIVAATADAAVAPYDPARLTHLGDARQVVVVTGAGRTSSYATLRTYERGANGAWKAAFQAMPARNGWAGWSVASARVQGNGTTPQGTFRLTTAFGLAANPGTRLPYVHADPGDYWVGDNRDPRTYNLFEPYASAKRTWRTSQAERLADHATAYAYAAMIDFNRPAASTVTWNAAHSEYVTGKPVDVRRGSAIFLHVSGTGSTAGCVSVSRANLVKILKWLNPAEKPRIVMAPESEIGKA